MTVLSGEEQTDTVQDHDTDAFVRGITASDTARFSLGMITLTCLRAQSTKETNFPNCFLKLYLHTYTPLVTRHTCNYCQCVLSKVKTNVTTELMKSYFQKYE